MAKVVKSTKEETDIDRQIDHILKTEKPSKKEVKKDIVKKEKTNAKKEKKHRKSLFGFFKEVGKEVAKVQWPSRKEMVKYSIATIFFILFFSLLFYVVQLLVALAKTWV